MRNKKKKNVNFARRITRLLEIEPSIFVGQLRGTAENVRNVHARRYRARRRGKQISTRRSEMWRPPDVSRRSGSSCSAKVEKNARARVHSLYAYFTLFSGDSFRPRSGPAGPRFPVRARARATPRRATLKLVYVKNSA